MLVITRCVREVAVVTVTVTAIVKVKASASGGVGDMVEADDESDIAVSLRGLLPRSQR